MGARHTARYRRLAAYVAAYGPPCWRCGARSSTVDHVPPLALHEHLGDRGGCCELRPACRRCNLGAGAAIAARRRARGGRTAPYRSRRW